MSAGQGRLLGSDAGVEHLEGGGGEEPGGDGGRVVQRGRSICTSPEARGSIGSGKNRSPCGWCAGRSGKET